MSVDPQKLLTVGLVAGAGTYLGLRHLIRRQRHFDFHNRVVLLTGGSRGLGLVLARQLVDAGARVAICARTGSELQRAEEQLLARGGEVLSSICDVRDQQQVEEMVERVIDRWGRIDVLMNVAGIIQAGPYEAMTRQDYQDAMDTHFWGPLHTCMAVVPHMRRRGWGRIVNVASIGGKVAVPHMLPYDASKFALVGFSNGLRAELVQHGIYVTTVCPGLMRTGSPRQATFKGQHRKEYAWFSIGDSLPLISISAESAAAKILRACQHGDGEVIVGGQIGVWPQRLAPQMTQGLLAAVNRWLPAMGGIGQQLAKGHQSQSRVSPSWITALGEQAARRNNQM